VAETTFMSYKIDEQTFHGLEATTGAMAIYLVLGMTVVKLMDLIEARFRIPGLMGR
jgi:ABC-type amino acid transport system permease subunit